MPKPLFAFALLCAAPAALAGQLYKCVDAHGKIEYANVPCKGKAEKFHPRKGSVTSLKMPKPQPAPAANAGSPTITPEQKRQMEELGIKPGGAVQMKPLVIPGSWLK